MATANPYLNFAGNCEEAFNFYKSVLGGDFGHVGKFSEMPGYEPGGPDGIMHISLEYGDSAIFGSDVPPSMGTITPGNNCYICLNPDTPDDARKIYDGLSAGGKIEMPFEKQFWGDFYGSFEDKFGTKWMVDVHDPEA